jgi:threonine dehydrogenase-like Zn-dependent dehydrogenase
MRRTRATATAAAATAATASAGTARRGVVIAGAGPVGLAASALLARYGVPSVVLERAKGLPDHPQVEVHLESIDISD